MHTQSAERDPDLAAAQLALLALAASAGRDATRPDVEVRIDPDMELLSLNDAAIALASMRKPLVCSAIHERGILAVRCQQLQEAGEIEQRVYKMHQEMDANIGGSMSHISDRYGEGDHLIFAVGGARSQTLSMSVAERWSRDYSIGVGMRRDDAKNPLAVDDPDYREANRLGAKRLIRFDCPEEVRGIISMEILEMPLGEGVTEEDRARAEQFLIRSAELDLRILRHELRGDGDEYLATRNASFRNWVERTRRERYQHLKSTFIPQLEEFFRGRQMPPVIVELIDLCRSIP